MSEQDKIQAAYELGLGEGYTQGYQQGYEDAESKHYEASCLRDDNDVDDA